MPELLSNFYTEEDISDIARGGITVNLINLVSYFQSRKSDSQQNGRGFADIPLFFSKVSGFFVLGIGVIVLIGSHMHFAVLAQILPKLPPMHFTMALGFILSGAGLALLATRRSGAFWFGGGASFLSLLTLSEYLSGHNFKIDQLFFISDNLDPVGEFPAQMSPPGAICLLLIGTALVLAPRTHQSGGRLIGVGILGCIVVLLSGFALSGVVLGIDFASRWRMPVHTATTFFILGTGLLLWAWSTARGTKVHLLRWLPVTVSLTLMTLVSLVSLTISSQLKSSNFWREHTYEVLGAAQTFLNQIFSIQRDARNFVFTGSAAVHESFQLNANRAPLQLIKLKQMAVDNVEQEKRLQRIGLDLDEVIASAHKLVDGGKIYDLSELVQIESSGQDIAWLNLTLGDLQAFTDEEHRLLSQRSDRVDGDFNNVERFLLYGSMMAVFLLVLANFMTSRAMARQEELTHLAQEAKMRTEGVKAQLEVSNKELEAFSYSVSHDLRAPLRHVASFVEMLQKHESSSLSEKGHRYLGNVSQSAKRMGILIDDLLAFSRIGQAQLEKREVNLDELIGETLSDFEAETEKRNINWIIHPLPTVSAARGLLRLVFVNLISNALKFTDAQAKATIEIGPLSSGGTETVIFIRDNGTGFDPKYTHKLFGVFQRLHSQSEFAGTGIGLANVQRIINRHGGRAWAEGVLGTGATFYISIPKRNEQFNAQ